MIFHSLRQVFADDLSERFTKLIGMSSVLCAAVYEAADQGWRIVTGSQDGARVWEYYLDASHGKGLTVAACTQRRH